MNNSIINGEIIVTNMSEELFNDALYFKEQAKIFEDENNFYLKWRYYRSSMICFCASTEAWINSIIKYTLENKTKSSITLTYDEQTLLNFINNPNNLMPQGFNNVRNKLYNFLPLIITGHTINWNNDIQQEFQKYLELSNMRNTVIHFAIRNKDVVHSDAFIRLINEAPDIIENLFKKYVSLGCSSSVASWYSSRKSRIIE